MPKDFDFFANPFDLNRDGEIDAFESCAAFAEFLHVMCADRYGSDISLSDLTDDEIGELISSSGVDPSGFGI